MVLKLPITVVTDVSLLYYNILVNYPSRTTEKREALLKTQSVLGIISQLDG
jgi:hypothetical protein